MYISSVYKDVKKIKFLNLSDQSFSLVIVLCFFLIWANLNMDILIKLVLIKERREHNKTCLEHKPFNILPQRYGVPWFIFVLRDFTFLNMGKTKTIACTLKIRIICKKSHDIYTSVLLLFDID